MTFVDTAGLRDTSDPIEIEGVSRTRAHIERADLVLWLAAPDCGDSGDNPGLPAAVTGLRIGTKSDLAAAPPAGVDLAVSAKTGSGLSALLDRVAALLAAASGEGDAVITRERHRRAFEAAHESLSRAGAALAEGHSELAAEDVRLALRALGQVTGRVDVEEVLDRLFATFCIGK